MISLQSQTHSRWLLWLINIRQQKPISLTEDEQKPGVVVAESRTEAVITSVLLVRKQTIHQICF